MAGRSASRNRSRRPRASVGDLVAQARGQLSQEKAAKAAGISVSALRRIESGDVRPQRRTLIGIARGLSTDPDPLLEAAGYERLSARESTADAPVSIHDFPVASLGIEYRMSAVEKILGQLSMRQLLLDAALQDLKDELAEIKQLMSALAQAGGAKAERRLESAADR